MTITPRTLKGFRDYLPALSNTRQQMIHQIEEVFSSFGYQSIDTPAIELTEILLGKGSEESDKQLYRFTDNGKRDVALRFDLTVPLARFIAMHANELNLPFRRYQIGKVWRGENPQKGRYREFYQCDVDIIGTEAGLADAEILAVIHKCFCKLDIEHVFRINNRQLFNGILELFELQGQSMEILRAIDKFEKLGEEIVRKELVEKIGLSEELTDKLFSLLNLGKSQTDSNALLDNLKTSTAKSPAAQLGIAQLKHLLEMLQNYGIPKETAIISPSIARGLDYYTGMVFETEIPNSGGFGSICSGGRYDNLASLYSKRAYPGVGASIGLDRLLAYIESNSASKITGHFSQVLVIATEQNQHSRAAEISEKMRNSKISVELFPSFESLKKQLRYANRCKIPYVIIIEKDGISFSLKDMQTGEQWDKIDLEQAINEINNRK